MSHSLKREISECSTSRTSVSDLEHCPLTGDEEQYTKQHQSRSLPRWPSNHSIFWKIWSLIMTACSFVLLVTMIHDKTGPKSCLSSSSTVNVIKDYPHPVDTWKEQNLIETKFYRDLRYMSLDHDKDYVWQEHLLMSTGNIRVPSEDGSGNSTLMGISMFHQMHCLAKMRMALQQAREGKEIGVDWTDDAHWPHCFDYLRSSIMCYADGTLEQMTLQPGPRNDGTFVKVIDGGVETRFCRDTRPLYELERQYGPNSQYGYQHKEFEVAPGR